jgi:drug/metabolite transporter (DMT)-like permease
LLTQGGLAVLAAAVFYAVSAVSGRILARTDRTEHMMFWLMLLMSLGAGAFAAPGWVSVAAGHVPLLAALAVIGFLAQLAITEAFNHGEASVVAPFEYTALAWGTAIDWLLWKTLPDGVTLLGAAIIVGSGLYLIRHESTRPQAEHP